MKGREVTNDTETTLMASIGYILSLCIAQEQKLYEEYTVMREVVEQTPLYRVVEPTTEPSICNCTCNSSCMQRLNEKENMMVSVVSFYRIPYNAISDVIKR